MSVTEMFPGEKGCVPEPVASNVRCDHIPYGQMLDWLPAALLLRRRNGPCGRVRLDPLGFGEAIVYGCHVKVRIHPDPQGWRRYGEPRYGRLSEAWAPGAIALPEGAPTRWFLPATPYRVLREEARDWKLSRAQADLWARRLLRIHRDRALGYGREWDYVSAVIDVHRKGRRLIRRHDGLRRTLGMQDVRLEQELFLRAELQAFTLRGR
ncbi:MAG: hypothetical protein D6775_14785 [Caldilineae bacterium]|nr:MAG: hypothetical protein D6775_14785 [Caldilineae bacterium]